MKSTGHTIVNNYIINTFAQITPQSTAAEHQNAKLDIFSSTTVGWDKRIMIELEREDSKVFEY